MAVTGKTGADAWYKTVKKQADLWKKYGPKLAIVVTTMETGGLLTTAEATALRTAFAMVPDLLSAIAKVAQYSGLW